MKHKPWFYFLVVYEIKPSMGNLMDFPTSPIPSPELLTQYLYTSAKQPGVVKFVTLCGVEAKVPTQTSQASMEMESLPA
jgi:hypothetical protein